MSRRCLPHRRPNLTVELLHNGRLYAVTLGFDPCGGRVSEVFTHGAKVGSAMDALLDDACIALSLLLQHGVEPFALAASTGRLADRTSPASIIGALADLLAREARA
jgi:hypothetical protein